MSAVPGPAVIVRALLAAAAALCAPTASGLGAAPDGMPPSGVAACAAIAADALRLACYDRAAGRSAPAASGAPVPATGAAPAAAPPEHGAIAPPGTAAGIAPGAPGTAGVDATPGPTGPFLDEASKAARDARRSLGSTLSERWELEPATRQGRFVLRPYKPMYVLPLHWTDSVNVAPSSDGKGGAVPGEIPTRPFGAQLQISFKSKLWETIAGSDVDLWAAYTQSSYWQVYTPELSRPFRETDHEPELFAIRGIDRTLFGWRARFVGLGINHQSNGRSEPLSRSWNRVIAQVGLERGDWSVLVRPWWRITERAEADDNPDIEDYLGRGEVVVVRKLGAQIVSVQLRHSLRLGDASRGSVLLDWAFPVSSYLKGHLRLFSGYGESLIDFNHRQTTIGLGFSLIEWL
jgi:phospholipase A1